MPAKHVLVVADSCFSGSLRRQAERLPPPDRQTPDQQQARDHYVKLENAHIRAAQDAVKRQKCEAKAALEVERRYVEREKGRAGLQALDTEQIAHWDELDALDDAIAATPATNLIGIVAKLEYPVRNNLARVPRNSDLHRRYLKKLNAQEDELERLNGAIERAQADLDQARDALTRYIADLKL